MVVLAFAPSYADAGLLSRLGDMFGLLALAQMWNLLAGYAGLVSIGQQGFVGLGAYALICVRQQPRPEHLPRPCCSLVSSSG